MSRIERQVLAAVSLLLLTGAASAEPPPLGDRIASYRIEVALDPGVRGLSGKETLTWRNATRSPADELQFHLYLNAFKNDRTSFMRESGGVSRGHRLRKGGWGWIDVLAMTRADDGSDLLPASEFIRPDDGNPDDETVLRVPLERPVPPGGVLDVEITFAARLPRVFARTGYKNDFYFAGQWFPKIGVLEETGWNCHQFHQNSEFFSDFGSYDVSITVPTGYVVGATGALVAPPADAGDGTTTHRFRQHDVHDFAWTADPDYIREVRWFRYEEQKDAAEEQRLARVLGLPPGSDALRLGDVEVILLIHPEHAAQIDRHFDAAFQALRWYGTWYGSYPYATLTVVDPAWGARGAGGMEYPTLITAGTDYFAPAGRQSPESVTIHEAGHQWWYGMVATNEFEEAFLDEGFNNYSQGHILEKVYGPNRDTIDLAPGIPYLAVPLMEIPRRPARRDADRSPAGRAAWLADILLLRPFGPSDDLALNTLRDLPFLNYATDAPIDYVTSQRRRYLQAPQADHLARRAWEYLDNASYGLNSYARTALALRTLEGIVGQDAMHRVMRAWFQRHRFTHPTFSDFTRTAEEVSGRPLDDFFRQAFLGSDQLDYEVTRATSRPPAQGKGVFGPPADRRTITGTGPTGETGDGPRDNEVLITRRGAFVWPQTIELRYEDGSSERRSWDGAYRWVRYRETGRKLVSVRIDPEETLALEANRSNNSRTVEGKSLAGLAWWSRVLQWAQHVLYFYSGIP